MTVERDWFWFWFYYALWLASVFTLVLVLRQSSENRSNIQEKEFELHCLRAPVQYLINTGQKRGNANAESKIMQISQIVKNRDWLINVNRTNRTNQVHTLGSMHT